LGQRDVILMTANGRVLYKGFRLRKVSRTKFQGIAQKEQDPWSGQDKLLTELEKL
jgi:hypothetical protein